MFNNMKSKGKALAASAVVAGYGLMGMAHAAIVATDVDPIVTDAQASITAVTPKALTLLAASMGVVIGFSVLKKLVNKSV